VLPVDVCGRRVAGALRAEGYPVVYEEFDGGHGVPGELARGAVTWWLGG
jgi:phospholipase/carboxylesterase